MEKRRLPLTLAVRITLQIAVFDRDYLYVSVTFLCVAQHKGGPATRSETFELKWLWQAQVTGSLTNCIHH